MGLPYTGAASDWQRQLEAIDIGVWLDHHPDYCPNCGDAWLRPIQNVVPYWSHHWSGRCKDNLPSSADLDYVAGEQGIKEQ